MTQILQALLILLISTVIGALPLIDWITYGLSGKELSKLGTGNISVSAAFYHGGQSIGILSVTLEALKGISVVFMAKTFFPNQPLWEILALIALVIGRYLFAKGAGTTNVTWGIFYHNPLGAMLILILGGISFTIFRKRRSGRLAVLGLMVVILSLQNPHQPEYFVVVITLAMLLAWIYNQIPDDLELSSIGVNSDSAKMFQFFRGDQKFLSLNDNLDATKVGTKAAHLSQLKKWGYNVPFGLVLKPGDDIDDCVQSVFPSSQYPIIVRSSAQDEDSENASAAGIYASFLNITDRQALKKAILDCLESYNTTNAKNYRQQHHQEEESISVIIQQQIKGMFSGVAFSRNPVNQLDDCVCIEALTGDALQVVSGEFTPEQYRVYFPELKVIGDGKIPQDIIINVAQISREIEQLYQGIPQDIEWTHDGNNLWLLQTRTITTLQPLWTRKIAAEVIPGVIPPLTWSINRPLTCGVWGEIFTIVLGEKADDLDFENTATLHYQRAYFNATLLGKIFLLMGLPSDSLEFLTRGAKFSKPPLKATIQNIPGLWRLLLNDLNLGKDFNQDYANDLVPILDELIDIKPENLSQKDLLKRINKILSSLKKVTYYSILAPLSFALRQTILQVSPEDLDNTKTPEISALNSLKKIALETRNLLPIKELNFDSSASLFAYLAEIGDGESILIRLDEWLNNYGYLSETATDISIPRWQEDPSIMREIFTQFIVTADEEIDNNNIKYNHFWLEDVQNRLNLKGKVSEIYSKLLAHLRYTFLALEKQFLKEKLLTDSGDIFFLKLEEIKDFIEDSDQNLNLINIIKESKFTWQENNKINYVPYLIYGNPPDSYLFPNDIPLSPDRHLTGIGASAGIIEGKVKILLNISYDETIDKNTILVVPYTEAGWSTILAQAGGLIAEVGGQLSHGAIIAREYNIPAVMDIHLATQILRNGQKVRLDGQKGIVEILD